MFISWRPIISSGAYNTLYVDANAKLLNGAANPYLGRTYLYCVAPVDSYSPALNNNLRAMVSYNLDLQRTSRWTNGSATTG